MLQQVEVKWEDSALLVVLRSLHICLNFVYMTIQNTNLLYMTHGRCLLNSSILDLISGRIFLAKYVSKSYIVLFQVGPLRC